MFFPICERVKIYVHSPFKAAICQPLYLLLVFMFSRATGRATLTAVRHCETKLKSTVMWRSLPPPTVVTHMARTVTQVLAPR